MTTLLVIVGGMNMFIALRAFQIPEQSAFSVTFAVMLFVIALLPNRKAS